MDQIDFLKTLYERVNREAATRGLEAQVSIAKDGLWIASTRRGHPQRKECLFWQELASEDREKHFADKLERSFEGAEALLKDG